MSSHAIYVVVWNMRDNKGIEGLEYWLSSIFSKAPDSQVIVAGTHLDEGVKVSAEHLKEKYPLIKHFFYTSCVGQAQGIDELREALVAMSTDQLMEIPRSYL